MSNGPNHALPGAQIHVPAPAEANKKPNNIVLTGFMGTGNDLFET